MNFKSFTKNISYVFVSNLISMLISALIILLLPRYIGVTDYSYWQLYIFYSTYIGFLTFGITDGAYLQYGGMEYNKLEKSKFVSMFWYFIFSVILFDFFIIYFYSLFNENHDKQTIILLVCINGLMNVPRSLITMMLEATNRIKDYVIITLTEKIFFLIFISILLLMHQYDYISLILADVFGKVIAFIYAVIICKDLVVGKALSIKKSFEEIYKNFTIGINLLVANLASLLIIGIVRMSVENRWNIETFGKVSFTLSISNFFLLMINAVGVVMFPLLRRLERDKLLSFYTVMRTCIMLPLLTLLIFYYPIKEVLLIWLPQYNESIRYMGILFPMVVFECKMSLLINTYLKTLRKEKWILKVNIISLGLSILTTGITVFWLGNLTLTVASIVLLLGFRCVFAEILLSRYLKINVFKDILLELALVTIFIVAVWNIVGVNSIVIYLLAFLVYLIIKKRDIKNAIISIKNLSAH